MKNFIKSFIGISLFASLAYAASTFTTNYNLEKPSDGSTQWGAAIRNNFDAIDSQMFINAGSIQNHIIDATDAHDASAISSVTPPPGFCTGGVNNVQEELDCFEDQINAIVGGGAVTIATNQTITGQKTFTQQLITQAGILNSGGITTSGALNFTGLTNGLLKVDGSSLVSASTLVNADINASAAIDRTKVASGTASHVVINDGTGVMSSEAQLAVSRGGSGVGSISAGGLFFGGATFLQDAVNLFWDDASDFLGIKTATPTHPLDVNGGIRARNYVQFDRRDESSAATINDLSSSKTFVKLDSTVTTINGIAGGDDGKTIKIHNSTGSNVTINHQSGSASAGDRIILPGAEAVIIKDDSEISFVYDSSQSKWLIDGQTLKSVSNLTTKGDLHSYSTTDARLPVGSNGQVLTADSNEATGLKWAVAGGSGGASGISLLNSTNPTFEDGVTSWTASGGSFTIATSGSDLLFDAKSGVFNASATAQTLSNSLVAIPNGLKNNPGVGSCWFKTAATDYKLQVYDGTTVLAETVIPALTNPAQVYAPFTFPSSGSISLRIASQSNAADLVIDNCFLGQSSTVEVSQAVLFGTAIDNASCQYSNSTAGSWQDMTQATGTCGVYSYSGGLSASGLAGPQPSFQIADMPAGDYQITVTGAFVCANSGTNQNCNFGLYDGTTRYNAQNIISSVGAAGFIGVNSLSFLVSKGASSTNQVFRIQSYVNNQATVNVDGTSGTSTSPIVFNVIRFPSSSEQAQRVNEQASYAILKTENATINASVTAAQAYTTASDASWAAASKTYLGSAAACSNANQYCMKIGKLKAGLYDAYLSGSTVLRDASATCGFRLLFDGSQAVGELTMLPAGAGEHVTNDGIHGVLKIDQDIYDKEIVAQIYSSGSGFCDIQSTASISGIEIGIKPTTMSIADLIIKGSVQSLSSSQINMCSGSIAAGGASGSSEGSCASAFSNGGTGIYQVTFPSGLFSAAPVCVCNAVDTSFNLSCTPASASSTSASFYIGVAGAASNAVPANFRCTGSKP